MGQRFDAYKKSFLSSNSVSIQRSIEELKKFGAVDLSISLAAGNTEVAHIDVPGGIHAIAYLDSAIQMTLLHYWDSTEDGDFASYTQEDYAVLLAYLADKGVFEKIAPGGSGAIICLLYMWKELIDSSTELSREEVLKIRLSSYKLTHSTLNTAIRNWKNIPKAFWEEDLLDDNLINNPLSFSLIYTNYVNTNVTDKMLHSSRATRHKYMNWVSTQLASALNVAKNDFLQPLHDLSLDINPLLRRDESKTNRTSRSGRQEMLRQTLPGSSLSALQEHGVKEIPVQAYLYASVLKRILDWLSVASMKQTMKDKSSAEMQLEYDARQAFVQYFLDCGKKNALTIQDVVQLFRVITIEHSLGSFLKQFSKESSVPSFLAGASGEILMGLSFQKEGYDVELASQRGEMFGEDLRATLQSDKEKKVSVSVKAFRSQKEVELFWLPRDSAQLEERLQRHPNKDQYLQTAREFSYYCKNEHTKACFAITPWFFGLKQDE